MLLDVLLDAVLDCLKELPFLFAAFFVVEAIAHRAASGMSAMLARAGRMGPLIGALLGCVPQCGFSVMASELYVSGVVTLGTLLSVYLSTSDEAVIILLGESRPAGGGVAPDCHQGRDRGAVRVSVLFRGAF